MAKTITAKVLFPAKTTAEWDAIKTTVLPKGALGVELAANDKTLIKVGDGVTDWENLPYVGGGSSSGTVDDSYKNYGYENNTIKLYRTVDKSDTPDEINLPEEQFLDQAKTLIVNPFTWSATDYPGSTDPNLNGKPVMVLAVKGDAGDTYSFLDLHSFIGVYDDELSESSENAVQNKVVTAELEKKIGTDDEVIINVVI